MWGRGGGWTAHLDEHHTAFDWLLRHGQISYSDNVIFVTAEETNCSATDMKHLGLLAVGQTDVLTDYLRPLTIDHHCCCCCCCLKDALSSVSSAKLHIEWSKDAISLFARRLIYDLLAERCNCIAMSGYCHDMLSVICCDASVLSDEWS